MSGPFDPFAGLTPNLIPSPPPDVPDAPGAGDATASLSPFSEPQDVDSVIKNLVLDRPLKLYVPGRENFPNHEFRIINSIPQEIAEAQRKGWREVTSPEFAELFRDLVAGTSKDGKAFRPILMAREKRIGDMIRERNRKELQSIYAGMDPKNKDLGGKYTDRVDEQGLTSGKFQGDGWRIKVR
jgi:hypothetical protein